MILINSKNKNLQIKTEEITKLLFSHKIKFTKLNVANLDYTNNEFIIDNISNKIKTLIECYEVIEQINWIGFTID